MVTSSSPDELSKALHRRDRSMIEMPPPVAESTAGSEGSESGCTRGSTGRRMGRLRGEGLWDRSMPHWLVVATVVAMALLLLLLLSLWGTSSSG